MQHHESLAGGESSLHVNIAIGDNRIKVHAGLQLNLDHIKKAVLLALAMGTSYASYASGILLGPPPGVTEFLGDPLVQAIIQASIEVLL